MSLLICHLSFCAVGDVPNSQVYTEQAALEAIASSGDARATLPSPVALVTGAGRGIGRHIALALARRGFGLALVARTLADLQAVAAECRAVRPDIVLTVNAASVQDRAAMTAVVEAVGDALAVVVSNAGTNRRKGVATADPSVWEDVIDTNLLSAMHLTRTALPHLLRRARRLGLSCPNGAPPPPPAPGAVHVPNPHIIFINSSLALERSQPMPGMAPYVTSKAALAAFARVGIFFSLLHMSL